MVVTTRIHKEGDKYESLLSVTFYQNRTFISRPGAEHLCSATAAFAETVVSDAIENPPAIYEPVVNIVLVPVPTPLIPMANLIYSRNPGQVRRVAVGDAH